MKLKPLVLIAVLLAAGISVAQERVFQMDVSRSQVEFTLGDILHTVHGTFQMKDGVLRFDPSTGAASGELVMDATTGNSGSNARDKKMKRDILQTGQFPTIVFTPQRIIGVVAGSGTSQVQMQGMMTLHGQSHPMILAVPVTVSGDVATADVHFVVPYVEWGLKNPSTLFLRVSDKVDIVVHAVGSMHTAATASLH